MKLFACQSLFIIAFTVDIMRFHAIRGDSTKQRTRIAMGTSQAIFAVHRKLSSKLLPTADDDTEQVQKNPCLKFLLRAACISRPNIVYAKEYLYKFNKDPGKTHQVVVKRVVSYNKRTLNFEWTVFQDPRRSTMSLQMLIRIISNLNSRRFTTGFLIILFSINVRRGEY